MAGFKKIFKSTAHHFAKNIVYLVAPDELSRKKIVSMYYATKIGLGNSVRVLPSHNAEELLSWRRTMRLKIDYSAELYRGNSFYGAGRAMREYAGVSLPIKACIEHGLYLGNYINPLECDDSGLPAVITFGPVREGHIHDGSDIPVLTVGPYIAYAKDYLDSAEMLRAKQMLGRTLLAFPSHSIDYVEKKFDTASYIEHLKKRAENEEMDTVLVSLYFSDILSGAADLYEQAGFVVVTCGYREDSFFLSRLKTLITLSDATSSNSMGTHIGYCVYMGKPHQIYQQSYEAVGVTHTDAGDSAATHFVCGGMEESKEIVEAFVIPTESITQQQTEVCDSNRRVLP